MCFKCSCLENNNNTQSQAWPHRIISILHISPHVGNVHTLTHTHAAPTCVQQVVIQHHLISKVHAPIFLTRQDPLSVPSSRSKRLLGTPLAWIIFFCDSGNFRRTLAPCRLLHHVVTVPWTRSSTNLAVCARCYSVPFYLFSIFH